MKIIRFEAENVKRLRAVEITPAGAVIQITGPNGAGKSSILDAIYWALAGAGAIPGRPVHEGEQKAHVTLDLGELVVTRRFTAAGGTSLTVAAASGARFPSPQAMLDQLLGSLTFDPLAFSRMSPKEQRAELAKLTGLTAQLDELTAANARDAAERTGKNRELRALQARLDAMADVEPTEPVDVAALLTEIDAAQAANSDRAAREHRRAQAAQQIADFRAMAHRHREEAQRLLALAEQAETEASALERKLAAAPDLPEPLDVDGLKRRLVDAQSINARAERWRQHQALAAEVAETRTTVDRLSAEIQAREEAKALVVRAADMPIPELGISDEGVTYRGLPFDQASSAEQLRVSVAIAMAAHPTLRVLRIKDGSLLDERSLAMLEEMAEAADYQVWVERVDTSGTVGIVMEDGAVVANHLQPAPEVAAA